MGRAGEMGRAGRITIAIGGALLAVSVGLGGCVGLVTVPLGLSGTSAGSTAGDVAGSGAVGEPAVPAAWESLDQQAAATCPGLSWAVLAAIGRVESDSGRSGAPGVASGANAAGAEDIWTWDRSIREVRDEGRWPRACGVSAVCEARLASGGRHTGFVACGADGWRVSGVAGGVAE